MDLHEASEASVVGGSPSGGGIPASNGSQARIASIAKVGGAVLYVVEAASGPSGSVDEGVEESKSSLARIESHVVQASDQTSHNRASGRRSSNTLVGSASHHAVRVDLASKGTDIRVGSATGVEVRGSRKLGSGVGEVAGHLAGLVGGDGEGVRESSSSAAPGCLRPDYALGGEVGAAHDSDVRGSSGEVRVEDSARSSAAPHTLIARGKEDADTQETRLHKLGVALVHVVVGGLLDFVITVAD